MKEIWIYGKHTVFSFMKSNPSDIKRVIALKKFKQEIELIGAKSFHTNYFENREEINKLFTSKHDDKGNHESVQHQGIVALINPPKPYAIESICDAKSLVVLDELTDMHNIGAIIRSACAFDIEAIIVSQRFDILKKPDIYKTSAGYITEVKIVEVPNIAQGLEKLKSKGFWILGMQLKDSVPIAEAKDFEKCALVMGSENKGLRNLTKKKCDLFVRVPISSKCESLNVSACASIAFYEISKQQ